MLTLADGTTTEDLYCDIDNGWTLKVWGPATNA